MSNIIEGYGAPTIDTGANIGDYYIDLETASFYMLTDVNYTTVAKERQFVVVYDHEGGVEYMWTKMGGSSGADVFHVTITTTGGGSGVITTGITCDKTYEEIVAARDAGAVIVCTMNLSGGDGCVKTGTVHFDADNYAISFVGTVPSISMGELNSYMWTHILVVERGDRYQWRNYKVTSAS